MIGGMCEKSNSKSIIFPIAYNFSSNSTVSAIYSFTEINSNKCKWSKHLKML